MVPSSSYTIWPLVQVSVCVLIGSKNFTGISCLLFKKLAETSRCSGGGGGGGGPRSPRMKPCTYASFVFIRQYIDYGAIMHFIRLN